MNSIITYLLWYIQYLERIIFQLLIFIAKFIPLKQFVFDDANSPNYQKFKTDKLPIIKKFEKQDYRFLLEYYLWKYHKSPKPISRRNGKTIPESTVCPHCNATHHYIYGNNGGKGEFKCKVCSQTFISGEKAASPLLLACPYCNHALQPKKDRKHFTVHKCVNPKCSYYLSNTKKLPLTLQQSEWQLLLMTLYFNFSIENEQRVNTITFI